MTGTGKKYAELDMDGSINLDFMYPLLCSNSFSNSTKWSLALSYKLPYCGPISGFHDYDLIITSPSEALDIIIAKSLVGVHVGPNVRQYIFAFATCTLNTQN